LVYLAGQNECPVKEIPLPASGVGYLSYEFVQRCDTVRLENQFDELRIPECCFVAGHIYIVFDHFTEKLHIFGLNYAERQIDLKKKVDELVKKLNNMDFSYMEQTEESAPCKVITNVEQSKKEYCEKVVELKKHIVAGDIIQAVPSRRVQLECDMSALELYRRLRLINPSPYLIYIDFGDFQLAGASPESLVRVVGGRASIHPIAGTIRRGKNEAEDEKLKIQLLNDPKENAEHLMLVDLARNDLGRVCKPGSVKVNQYMETETFSHVIHLVSNVEGDVAEGIPPVQVLRSSFPAGTVSGAPKISAMKIVSRLEKVKRRFYAGAVGYIRPNGDLDFCIAIRCALKQGKIWSLQAGSGIVYDSDPEREFEETNEKLGALIATFETSEK
ncbi:MAG: chorismate-binding protein, partial [Treponema sp.]|nr:chorismate-binding protein [Treponema sp.]